MPILLANKRKTPYVPIKPYVMPVYLHEHTQAFSWIGDYAQSALSRKKAVITPIQDPIQSIQDSIDRKLKKLVQNLNYTLIWQIKYNILENLIQLSNFLLFISYIENGTDKHYMDPKFL